MITKEKCWQKPPSKFRKGLQDQSKFIGLTVTEMRMKKSKQKGATRVVYIHNNFGRSTFFPPPPPQKKNNTCIIWLYIHLLSNLIKVFWLSQLFIFVYFNSIIILCLCKLFPLKRTLLQMNNPFFRSLRLWLKIIQIFYAYRYNFIILKYLSILLYDV